MRRPRARGYAARSTLVKKSREPWARFQPFLDRSVADFRDELLEPLDPATAAHPRVDRIAPGADPLVFGLEVEAAVEVEGRAILIELGANPRTIDEDEVDLFRPGQQGALDRRGRNALRALFLDPFELGRERARLDRDAQDDLVLNDQAGNGLTDRARLPTDQPDEQ